MATKAPKKTPKAPAKKNGQTKTNGSEDICFVIMPFGGWLDDYYTSIYCAAIESVGLAPHRADDLFRPSTIVNDIWAYTKKAKVLLADLTGKNPNVFYELGLAHALGKPVILVAESMEDIPFDLRALRIILYDKNAPDWGHRLNEKIQNALTEVLIAPIEAVLPAFIEVKAAPKPTISAEQKDLIEIKQEMDLLRRELRTREMEARDTRIDTSQYTSKSELARSMVRQMMKEGVAEELIIFKAKSEFNAPEAWTRRQIERYQSEFSQGSLPLTRNISAEKLEAALAQAKKLLSERGISDADSTNASADTKQKQAVTEKKPAAAKRAPAKRVPAKRAPAKHAPAKRTTQVAKGNARKK